MNIHYIQHVPFENLGSMEAALLTKGHSLSVTHIYNGEKLPELKNVDWLIVMGGPMGVYDDDIYPWLKDEKEFIASSIAADKLVLGICLGAQLIAAALGARVYPGKHREIGWFDINRSTQTDETFLADCLPESLNVFHWHGDTFDLPDGAKLLASSAACRNQGFVYDKRTVALQFHLETTATSAKALIQNCGDELDNSKFVQNADEIMAKSENFTQINALMELILSSMKGQK